MGEFPVQKVFDEIYTISWDLSRDFRLELVPLDIIRLIKEVRLVDKVPQNIFPKFNDFYRNRMIVTVEMSTLPINLRSVIGKRSKMEQYGQNIVKSLLNSYLWLKKHDYRVRTIQPANIYISPEGKELNFVDLRSLVKGQPNSLQELHGSMPYNC